MEYPKLGLSWLPPRRLVWPPQHRPPQACRATPVGRVVSPTCRTHPCPRGGWCVLTCIDSSGFRAPVTSCDVITVTGRRAALSSAGVSTVSYTAAHLLRRIPAGTSMKISVPPVALSCHPAPLQTRPAEQPTTYSPVPASRRSASGMRKESAPE